MNAYRWTLGKSALDDLTCRAEIETELQRTNAWTEGWDDLGDWD